MSYRIEFNQKFNYCYVYYAGNVTLLDLKRVFLDFLNHPSFVRNMNLLVDFEMAEHACSPAELINFFSFQDDYEEQRGIGYKVAFVCPKENAFKQIKNLLDYARSMSYSSKVFYDKQDALAWFDEV